RVPRRPARAAAGVGGRSRTRFVELDVAPLQRAAGLIDDATVAGQRDAEGVRVLSGLVIVGEVDRVPVTVHTVDRGAAREVAARGGGARAIDGAASRVQ